MKLEQYVSALEILENEIKEIDNIVAHNIVKELSVIYVKLSYEKLSVDQKERQYSRLLSMVDYIMKVIPNHAEKISGVILDIVEKEKGA